MASYTISPIWGAGAQLFDNSGNVLTGGKIYTYLAGTTTPATTYTTPTGTVANSNPIVANSAGRLTNEIWFPVSGAYKFVLKDANDVLIATYDNIPTTPQPPIVNDASSISYDTGYIADAGNFTIGETYRIETVGTTDFIAIGASANVNGVLFTATGVGSGTGTAEYVRTVENKLQDIVSVKDFGAIGDGVTNDTAAIQAALNQSVRRVFFPAGQYRITSTLVIQQDAILEGDGGSGELNSTNITEIQVDGDFDGMEVNTASPSYYGWLTMKRITINKIGGTANTNTGLVMANFGPHVILENVACWNFATGFNLYIGLAQLNSCEARWCTTAGYEIKGTSFVIQNCYAKDGGAGFVINDQTVYSTLISCAADGNTYNAYEFRGTTGPFTGDGASSIVRMQNCGAEIAARYMYVDGNFDIEVSSPSISEMTTAPYFASIESAYRIMLRNIGAGVGLLNWLSFNQTKCNKDVVVVEGDMPHFTLTSPPATSYPALPIAQVDFKTLVSSTTNLGLAKTRIPSLTIDPGASSGVVSTVEKGIFVTQAVTGARLRFRVEVLSNGFYSTAQIRYSAMNTSGAGDSGGQIYLTASNTSGINYSYNKSSADINIVVSNGTVNGGPNGGTYYYFDVYSNYGFNYLWDVTAYVNFEVLKSDMHTNYNNWTVSII